AAFPFEMQQLGKIRPLSQDHLPLSVSRLSHYRPEPVDSRALSKLSLTALSLTLTTSARNGLPIWPDCHKDPNGPFATCWDIRWDPGRECLSQGLLRQSYCAKYSYMLETPQVKTRGRPCKTYDSAYWPYTRRSMSTYLVRT